MRGICDHIHADISLVDCVIASAMLELSYSDSSVTYVLHDRVHGLFVSTFCVKFHRSGTTTQVVICDKAACTEWLTCLLCLHWDEPPTTLSMQPSVTSYALSPSALSPAPAQSVDHHGAGIKGVLLVIMKLYTSHSLFRPRLHPTEHIGY